MAGETCAHCGEPAARSVALPEWVDAYIGEGDTAQAGPLVHLCGEAWEELAAAVREARRVPRLSPAPATEAAAAGSGDAR